MFIINDNTRPLTKALLFAMLFLPICLFAQQKHALLIGISDYPQYEYADASWEPIHGTNDVHLISPILAKQGFAINTLLNEAATHSAIVNVFEKKESYLHSFNSHLCSSSIKHKNSRLWLHKRNC